MHTLRIGRDRLGDLGAASRLEWLVTNGIGGYAAGTLGGALTRRYHGLLIAARKPPVDRTLLLAKLAERIRLAGEWIDLDLNHWVGGTSSPLGHLHLESFALEGGVPVWTWAIGDTRLEKRVWMEQGENTTYVQYRLAAAPAPVSLSLKALVDHRDHHLTTSSGEWRATIDAAPDGLRIRAFDSAMPLWLFAKGAEFKVAHVWYRSFSLAVETERGLDDRDEHLFAAEIERTLAPGEAFTVVASTRADAVREPLDLALTRRREYERSLLDAWAKRHGALARTAPDWIARLVLAADAFVVDRGRSAEDGATRAAPGAPKSVLAGYPWFTDWGRDTMIALPGLTLTTGRPELARAVLLQFAAHVDRGMLPNYFPDDGSPAEYNTVDAALWFFQAVRAYVDETGDTELLAQVFPALEDVVAWYTRGTRFGIRVDPDDGLVTQGEDGVALTWMDARVEDWVVTPRRGKPVEINALWYAALVALAGFARQLGRPSAAHEAAAGRVAASFARFWNDETHALADVLDGPAGTDTSLRPNQVFAASLPDSPLDPARRRAVVDAVGASLLTSHGLRSLSARDREYRGHMTGDRRTRDGAYHQGTVWTWLLPHYALAHFRVHGDRDAALALLEPFGDLAQGMAVGTLPEVADGDAPHAPRGCFAQAWTVAEVLRAWHTIAAAKPAAKRTPRAGAGKSSRAAARKG